MKKEFYEKPISVLICFGLEQLILATSDGVAKSENSSLDMYNELW